MNSKGTVSGTGTISMSISPNQSSQMSSSQKHIGGTGFTGFLETSESLASKVSKTMNNMRRTGTRRDNFDVSPWGLHTLKEASSDVAAKHGAQCLTAPFPSHARAHPILHQNSNQPADIFCAAQANLIAKTECLHMTKTSCQNFAAVAMPRINAWAQRGSVFVS